MKIKTCIEFLLYKAQMFQNKPKSSHFSAKYTFFREYFLLQGKSSLLIFHFKSKYCLVVQHRKHGTKQKETRVFVSRAFAAHCIPLEKCRVLSCFFFLPYFYFPYFLSGLSIAYQINPYIKRNLEYISIQAFHFFKL